jgi:colicin import membrane protein
MWQVIRENPRAVLYAVLMHIVLLVLLVFSLDWTPKVSRPAGQKVPIEATLVDQKQLDAIAERKRAEERKAEEAKRQQALEEKRKAEAEQKKQAEAERKRKAEAEAKRKEELAAKQKVEAERKRKAELAAKQKAEAEARRKAELAAKQKAEAEAKRKAELAAKQKAEAERKRKAEAAARAKAEAEMQAQLAAERAQLEAQRVQSVLGEYIAYIADRVERNWLRPPGSPAGLKCTVNVKLIPGGDVVSARVVQGSGDTVFDDSAEKAVLKASPLPVPDDPSAAKHFRDFNFVFKPH